MPEPTLREIAATGVATHEQFVADCREMDLAWAGNRFDEWLEEKLDRERITAGSGPAA